MDCVPFLTNWLVVYTKPRMEKVCKESIERVGAEVRLPMTTDWRGASSPLFPRYLFARDGDVDDPVSLRYTSGVCDLLRRPDRSFARISGEVVEVLMAQEHHQLPFRKGERLGLNGTSGIHGRFAGMSGQDRVILLLRLFESTREVVVGMDQVHRMS